MVEGKFPAMAMAMDMIFCGVPHESRCLNRGGQCSCTTSAYAYNCFVPMESRKNSNKVNMDLLGIVGLIKSMVSLRPHCLLRS